MKEWNRLAKNHYAALMFNKENGEVWADYYLSENNWNEYKNKNVRPIPLKLIIWTNTKEYELTNAEIIEITTEYIAENLNFTINNDIK